MADHDDLDRLVRASLERRAGEVDTTVRIAERAKGAVSRRRTARIAIGAAAAVIVAVTVTGLLVSGDDDSPRPADRGDHSLPTEWRTEYWRDLQVEVPADWGWGAAPKACGVGPLVGIDGRVGYGGAYVGRPIGNTDMCVTEAERPPGAPYVWLGADVEPGVEDVGGGYVQETIEVNGTILTVATDDSALRERILESASGGETCISELEKQPTVNDDYGVGSDGITICVYRNEQPVELTYSATLGEGAARAFESAYGRGEPLVNSGRSCDVGGEFNWVVLVVDGRTYVVSPTGSCPNVDGPEGPMQLSRELSQPWAVGGIRAVVSASAGVGEAWVYDLFIGPQG
jgi:hypothetical protein